MPEKTKNSENWFVGRTNDEERRTSNIKFDFLEKGKDYMAIVYKDAKDAHWETNPKAYEITKYKINSKSKLSVDCVSGGGYAISIIDAEKRRFEGIREVIA